MKTLRQISSIISIILFCILSIGANQKLFAQEEVTPELSKFVILVETTNDGIKLTNIEGSAFKELAFSLTTNKKQCVDQYGMSSVKKHKSVNDDNFANFIFKIKKTKKGIKLEGIEGTAWKNLSFSCPNGVCHQYIDQNGMTDLK